jgi:threonine dehydrogenase-like Zn-dependent dehydrogenase
VKALVFERSVARYAAAAVAGRLRPGAGARIGPLSLQDVPEPVPPRPDWVRVRPRLSGICGSDLATIDGTSSRYFEPIVSFPFVPGHEVVGELDDGTRVVLEPVLGCAARGIEPPCHACATGRTGNCERVAFGHLAPGLQTGFCSDTGGGWSLALVAHPSQLHPVPDDFDDTDAVMVEPTACAVHAVLGAGVGEGETVVVLGAGTLGLLAVTALRQLCLPGTIVVAAKHPSQRRWALELGADVVAEPAELTRAVRRVTGSLVAGEVLTGGAHVVVDCVGSADSISAALAVARPRARVALVGMPGRVGVDLTPLWHKEIALVGAYAYGAEPGGRRTFEIAFEVVRTARLGRLVSATYPLDRYREALEHAANAGSRGAVKICFDTRSEKRR